MIRHFLKDAATFIALVTFVMSVLSYAGQIGIALHPGLGG